MTAVEDRHVQRERQPVVLPVRPVLGWRRAGRAHRVLALSVPVLVAVWAVLLAVEPAAGDVVTAVSGLTVGPVAYWCLARVLRPEVSGITERHVRHALASTATCLGTAVVVGIAVDTRDGDFLAAFVLLAVVGLVVTVPWGFVAMLVRAARLPPG